MAEAVYEVVFEFCTWNFDFTRIAIVSWNFAILSSNLSFIVFKYSLFISTKYSEGNDIIGYYIITMGSKPFMKLHLRFTSYILVLHFLNATWKRLRPNCVHVGRCKIGNKLSKTKWINRVWGFKVHILSILTADWFVFWSIILAAHPSVKTAFGKNRNKSWFFYRKLKNLLRLFNLL